MASHPSQHAPGSPRLDPGSGAGPAPGAPPAGSGLEERAAGVGRELRESLLALIEALPEGSQGPQRLAGRLALDKVLASRLLKALRQGEPLAVLYHAPGPEPLRRLVRAARRQPEAQAEVLARAEAAIARFDELIRAEAGDRTSLAAILSAWLPEARDEFELRLKQAAFRAMSELKGVSAEVAFSAVLVHPSREAGRLDLVWVIGARGLQRLRPGARVRFLTRRMGTPTSPRHPTDLEGRPIEDALSARLVLPGSGPPPPIVAERAGEAVHYRLGDTGFGPRSAADVLFAELNRAELPAAVPAGSKRRAYFFHEVDTPSRRLSFDVWLHADVYPGAPAELAVYDACNRGPADVNDPARDFDKLDVQEHAIALGSGLGRARSADIPHYAEVLRHVCERVGWQHEALRGHRAQIAFPVYGSQVVLAFRAPELLAPG